MPRFPRLSGLAANNNNSGAAICDPETVTLDHKLPRLAGLPAKYRCANNYWKRARFDSEKGESNEERRNDNRRPQKWAVVLEKWNGRSRRHDRRRRSDVRFRHFRRSRRTWSGE